MIQKILKEGKTASNNKIKALVKLTKLKNFKLVFSLFRKINQTKKDRCLKQMRYF